MSERTAAFGKLAPEFKVEHNGTTFAFRLAITEGVLLEIENRLYQRAVAGLVGMRDAYPEGEYVRRLDDLRAARERGDYDVLQSEAVQKFLGTVPGQLFLLAIMGGTNEKALVPLFLARGPEMAHLVQQALEDSLPKGQRPDRTTVAA